MRFAHMYARMLRQGANGLLTLSRPLPQTIRVRVETFARLLRNLEVVSVQPNNVCRMMEKPFLFKSILDSMGLGALIGFASAYLLGDSPLFLNIPAAFVALLILIVFVSLTSFLSMSGDIYLDRHDEFQQLVIHEASAYSLRITAFLLVLIIVACTLIRPLRNDAPALLCIVLVITRLAYLIRLAQLRWQDLADIDLVEEEPKERAGVYNSSN